MECPFHSDRQDECDLAVLVAKKLIQNCSELGISDIVIPCVDQSSLPSQKEIQVLLNIFKESFLLRRNLIYTSHSKQI